ncbi:hypothetical protein C1645_833502 [Glomus cerebriforme]|uniref:Uncharacterized protein n=1 Tax=Glomus cerebriforme TaxID=658196 RepID=A0A397SG06_9GLOM|nr:hypothetical protein C1645_833502 [Glomus cerebriforme]
MLHMGMLGAYVKRDLSPPYNNRISTQYTLDNTTTFWIHVQAANVVYSSEKIREMALEIS